jgi:hypothetical protein
MFDIFRICRSCFYCGTSYDGRDLFRVNFSGKFLYYHKNCLSTVLSRPDQNLKKLLTAIKIYSQIVSDLNLLECDHYINAQRISTVQKPEIIQQSIKHEDIAKFRQIFRDEKGT